MNIKRNLLGLLAVTGLAFAAGRLHVLSGGESTAWAEAEQELSKEMEAYVAASMPGDGHLSLDRMVGEWDGVFKIWMDPECEPMVSRGTVSRQWVLDGRFIKEIVEATSDWGTFTGIGYIGYNNVDGQYEFVWMDSMSTGMYIETGTYDPDSMILATRGSHRDPASGKVLNSFGKLDLSDSDRHTYVGYITGPSGKSFKHFEGTTTRQK